MDKTTAIPLTQPFHIAPPATQTTASAGGKTAAKTSVSTHKTMAKPTAKTNMQHIGNVSPPAIRLQTQRSPRKQTALTAFYAIQPLHIIQKNQTSHNSNKRNFQKLSSTLPTFQQQKASRTSKMSPPLSAKKRKCVQTQSLIVEVPKPSQEDYYQMATSCDGITPEQMELAFDAALQFMGYKAPAVDYVDTYTTNNPEPGNDETTDEGYDSGYVSVIEVKEETSDESSIESPSHQRQIHYSAKKSSHTRPNRHSKSSERKHKHVPPSPNCADERDLTSTKLASFTSDFAPGNNFWVTEQNCQRVLEKTYGFHSTPPLVLKTGSHTLYKLFKLTGDIIGRPLTHSDLTVLCNHDDRSHIDPVTRFRNARLRGIEAVDVGSFTKSTIHLHDILFGKQGALYENTKNQPPKNCVIIMKIKAKIPNDSKTYIDHAVFLPDVLMLITFNKHTDLKDKRKRVRNAWQIRQNFFNTIYGKALPMQFSTCSKRIAGRLFGGGDGTTAELLRAAIIYNKIDMHNTR